MKIYTKKGDSGETGLYGGARVRKTDLRIEAYGTIDEANAVLGLSAGEGGELAECLMRVQAELFQLGAELATPHGQKVATRLIEQPEIQRLENEIDAMEAKLAPMKHFILPGGVRQASDLHLARTVLRRAERRLVTLNDHETVRPEVLQYVNRLSDHLFVCARYANFLANRTDVPWIAPH